ncbi:MAG: glutamate-1-semialdehyde 2,1-aminomutase [SAR324 cluster bacterium]|nr:glutamate-1-semialdehyde 2,1-aminomutase [SAR324 cluster bacterium]MBF0352113.1 glutamate-1-semialdehyde 2,1-aminomutase [SAR324 cluster bacterium]
MLNKSPKSRAFFERAQKVIPYGVSSSHRYWGDYTPVLQRGNGAYVYDFDGNRYIDYRLGFGPVILGHAHPYVNQRVMEAIQQGVTFAATQPYEVSVAERIIAMCPFVDMVRLDNTGSDATRHALRLARGYTGRDLVVKFEGAYHGDYDYMLWTTPDSMKSQVGNRNRPIPHKTSLGVPDLLAQLLLPAVWNDREGITALLQEKGDAIAAIIVEPILANAGGLMPAPGFLEFLRTQCDQYGIVLIFDEVKTGFRIAPGGASEYFGVIPDIVTYAKAMANGYPVSAVGGKRKIMMALAPGKVVHAGTYNGNVVVTSAADATLEYMQTHDVFGHLNQIGRQLMDGLGEILSRHSIPHHIHGVPALFGLTLSTNNPTDWRQVVDTNLELSEKLLMELVNAGIMTDSDPQQTWYVCDAHTTEDIAETLDKFEIALRNAKN